MLEAIAPDLWSARQHISVHGLPVRSRMAVVRLPDGTLWLHSPIAPSPALRAALDALGTVRWIVAPNRMHHLFAGDWQAHYPQAELWGAPGLAAKRPDLPQLHSLDQALPAAWQPALAMQFFTGIPILNECVWLHQPSASLIVTDLLQYYPQDLSLSARLFNSLNGTRSRLAMPRALRFAIKDRAAASASASALCAWPVERLVLAHDAVLTENAGLQLQQALAFLRAPRR
ncbi:hypothetical protein M2375_003794 [Comamonas sp. BIGb0152]|uniref:DUF4336 domain-containing protein n=1 Tax=Comamonas sp. BIGb0152 TaxID=2940601 RepID=UPI00216832ED|nr:DUF4336 domain-containing protein [Comamonas sp. BIGb0152]MCS4295551.1 hypothetical protein [Comamonas sp. BIGb0152]